MPTDWQNYGFSASSGSSPAYVVPAPDASVGWTGQMSPGCYNLDPNDSTLPPVWQAACDVSTNADCLNGYCQSQGYLYYYPGFNWTEESAGYTNAVGICIEAHLPPNFLRPRYLFRGMLNIQQEPSRWR